MIIKSKPLSRRTLLRGLGVGLALPFLDIMRPTESYAATISRTAFVYVPNGWYRLASEFFPTESGSNYTTPKLLTPLQDYQNDFMMISNLFNQGGRSNGDGAGDHARAGGTYLSSVKILKNQNQVSGGQTIDRHISDQLKAVTPIDMLLMGYGGNDGNDSGYNSLNTRISWRSATEPVHWERDARATFNRLVSNNVDGNTDQQEEIRRQMRKSVLDYVIYDDLPRLRNKLGQLDKEKLDSYLSGLRDVERKLDILDGGGTEACNLREIDDSDNTMSAQISLMFDLMINAFECDLTRVAVIGLGRELNGSKPNGLGLANGWHSTSHYGTDEKKADYEKIGMWVAERAKDLVQKLDESALLQSSLISFGAGTGGNNSQAHGDDNLPTLLIGHANGTVQTGRHLKLSSATPIANLWSAMAYHAGVAVPNDRWGDYGTGRIDLS